MLVLGDPLANGRTSHLLPALLSLLFARFCPLFSSPPRLALRLFLTSFPRSAVPWFSQTHNGVPTDSFIPTFLSFFLPFFLSFFPFPRKRTPVAVPSRFSFATSTLSFIYSFINGEKRVFENFEFYTNSWNSKNFVSTIPQANRFSFRFSSTRLVFPPIIRWTEVSRWKRNIRYLTEMVDTNGTKRPFYLPGHGPPLP